MFLPTLISIWQNAAEHMKRRENAFGDRLGVDYIQGVTGRYLAPLSTGYFENTLPLLTGLGAMRPDPFFFPVAEFLCEGPSLHAFKAGAPKAPGLKGT